MEPPTGDGPLVLDDIVDGQPPPFNEQYAFTLSEGSLKAIGLDAGQVRFDAMADGHFRAIGEAYVAGRFVIGAAHVFAPGQIVTGYYHSAAPDENRPIAWSILNSIAAVDE
jgi:hypothetical protein